jgi:N-acetylmuramoyl-L-alanine amidase
MRLIKKIILHCSDSDYAHHDDIEVIRGWHVNERKFKDVGYHFFIKFNGTVQKGRDIKTIGAHTLGQNADSIGICLHGRHNFTEAQFEALRKLVNDLCKQYGIVRNSGIFGHCDFANKSCPNFDYKKVLGI